MGVANCVCIYTHLHLVADNKASSRPYISLYNAPLRSRKSKGMSILRNPRSKRTYVARDWEIVFFSFYCFLSSSACEAEGKWGKWAFLCLSAHSNSLCITKLRYFFCILDTLSKTTVFSKVTVNQKTEKN